MEKTVHELCLVCRGERWIPDPKDAGHSIPCPYCDEQGWVTIAPSSLGEDSNPGGPGMRKNTKESK